MANIGNLLITAPSGVWVNIINWLSGFISNYGLVIIVLTIGIKVLMSPLDVWQKSMTNKQQEMMNKMKPEMDKINKKYANDQNLKNQKTMELYQKSGYNPLSSCLGMLITMGLTLFIFISLFSNLNNVSYYKISSEFETLQTTYYATYENSTKATNDEKVQEAQEQVLVKYDEIKEGFLWIKSLWKADTSTSPLPDASSFLKASNTKFSDYTDHATGEAYASEDKFKEDYATITKAISDKYPKWNGYYILAILAGVLSWLSFYLNKKLNPASVPQQAVQYDANGNPIQMPDSNKMMSLIFPILMVVISLSYNSAFSLYLVMSSVMSLLITVLTAVITKAIKNKKVENKQ